MATLSRPTITDDSGSNTDGTIADAAWVDDFCDRIDALAVDVLAEAITQEAIVQTTTSTGTANDFALTTNATLLRCNNASDLTITGFTPGTAGQLLTVVSIGAGNVFFSHQAGGSTAAYRLINFATSAVTPLAAGVGAATFKYDSTTARWRLITHAQGAGLTPTFAAGDYTGPTWTVGSGDVVTQSYYLSERTLKVKWYLVTTTVSGSPTALLIGNGAWGGFTCAKASLRGAFYNDNGAGIVGGLAQAAPSISSGTAISIAKLNFAFFGAATNATETYGDIEFEVT